MTFCRRSDDMLQLEKLTHSYPSPEGMRQVVDGIDLTVEMGEFVSVIGPGG